MTTPLVNLQQQRTDKYKEIIQELNVASSHPIVNAAPFIRDHLSKAARLLCDYDKLVEEELKQKNPK